MNNKRDNYTGYSDAIGIKCPKIVVLTLGVNGVSSLTEEQFKGYYVDLINLIKKKSPDTKIITQSIYPVCDYYEMKSISMEKINRAKREGRRVIAVGTTSVRTLESAADENGFVKPTKANTEIFIYPPYKFKCVDSLITNFHLPKSTLVMLVASLTGREKILEIYNTAVAEEYRFFSFGDAMMIL